MLESIVYAHAVVIQQQDAWANHIDGIMGLYGLYFTFVLFVTVQYLSGQEKNNNNRPQSKDGYGDALAGNRATGDPLANAESGRSSYSSRDAFKSNLNNAQHW